MFDLYREQILERFKAPRFAGSVNGKTHSAEGANMSCGDEVHWELQLEHDQIKSIRHQTRACAICTASADLLAEQFEGKNISAVNKYSAEDIAKLLGIPLSPTRLKCALLPLETLKEALKTDSN